MAELTIEQLIKIILGVFVIVAVIGGIYLLFKDKILEFFKSLPTGAPQKEFLLLIK
jgi:hypothetical protein